MIAVWNAPLGNGKSSEELLLAFDGGRERRILVLPAWFDEANKLRRFTLETMRALDALGCDSFLPDLPGCNDSIVPLKTQTIAAWKTAANAAAAHVKATHLLCVRAGALIAPSDLPGWHYAPQTGAKQLRGMIRARTIAARETGKEESSDMLLGTGRREGLALAGWQIGAEMLRELETAEAAAGGKHEVIAQKQLGGPGLWLRAEPDEDPAQSKALATLIAGEQAPAT